MTVYHMPKNEQILNELYAVLSTDQRGEGIVSVMTPQGAMPMVFGHKRMLIAARKAAELMVKDTKKKLIIVKYTKSEVLEEIEP